METRFGSLDLQTFASGDYEEPTSGDRIAELTGNGPVIARGAGVSYVAASFGERTRSIGMRHLNRILCFEPEEKRITVEAGTSLGALYDFLLPHRLYVAVQPGHPQISVGGCVACNIHGKNPQRDGVFADLVDSLQLFHPAQGVMTLSRKRQAEAFELTCGGFGLTGVILNVTLRLTDLPGSIVEVRKVPVSSLEDACEQVEALKSQYDFLYTWNDLSTFGKHMGRGYVSGGRFAPGAASDGALLGRFRRLDPMAVSRRWRPKVFHRQIIPWASRIGFMWQMQRPTEELSLFQVMYPGVRWSFYFDLYGPGGFFAHMVLVPDDRRRAYIRRLEHVLRTHQEPMFCTSIKAFAGAQRLLHFNGTGLSLHFHIPNTAGGRQLAKAMEDLSREFSVIRTIYFDSRLSAADARFLYPEYDTFKERLHRFDPQRRFASSLSQRLDL
jgi:decaprenylphospho-beta-D-ribofuranose 2-oxidase